MFDAGLNRDGFKSRTPLWLAPPTNSIMWTAVTLHLSRIRTTPRRILTALHVEDRPLKVSW